MEPQEERRTRTRVPPVEAEVDQLPTSRSLAEKVSHPPQPPAPGRQQPLVRGRKGGVHAVQLVQPVAVAAAVAVPPAEGGVWQSAEVVAPAGPYQGLARVVPRQPLRPWSIPHAQPAVVEAGLAAAQQQGVGVGAATSPVVLLGPEAVEAFVVVEVVGTRWVARPTLRHGLTAA